MSTNQRMLMAAFVLLPLAGGCGSRFAGEWVQESAALGSGPAGTAAGERRLALRFDPPTTVRVGMYLDAAGVVEADTVALSEYLTLQNRTVAQFGAYTARVEDGQLVTYIGGKEAARFRRVEGRSIFPSRIQLPHLTRASPPSDALAPSLAEAAAGVRGVTPPVLVAVE